jgi:glutamyl endopeptidase
MKYLALLLFCSTTFATFAAVSGRTVIGTDERQLVTDTTVNPYRKIVQIETAWPSKETTNGSGAFVSPRHILTAAHMVKASAHGGVATWIRITPAKNGSVAPYGYASVMMYRIFPEWSSNQDLAYDMALLTIEEPLGDKTGTFAYSAYDDATLAPATVYTAGYPGDVGNTDYMYHTSGTFTVIEPLRLHYTMDTYGGQSGSPVWLLEDNVPKIVSVHNTGGTADNGSVRLTADRVAWLNKYIAEDLGYGDTPPTPAAYREHAPGDTVTDSLDTKKFTLDFTCINGDKLTFTMSNTEFSFPSYSEFSDSVDGKTVSLYVGNTLVDTLRMIGPTGIGEYSKLKWNYGSGSVKYTGKLLDLRALKTFGALDATTSALVKAPFWFQIDSVSFGGDNTFFYKARAGRKGIGR